MFNFQDEDEGIDVSSVYNERNKAWGVGTGPFVYELFSIMIHSGSASGGHYYAYIKDFPTGEWFCFNDQSVTKVSIVLLYFVRSPFSSLYLHNNLLVSAHTCTKKKS